MTYTEIALDIETRPSVVYTFQLFKPVIGIDQIIEPSDIMCFSWQKRVDGKNKGGTGYMSEWDDGKPAMVDKLWELLDEADAVVTYNGKKFDEPWIKGILIQAGKTPPTEWFSIDLYWAVRQNMKLLSNKLDYAARTLLQDHKTAHSGFKLWRGCMDGEEASRRLMKRYSIKDTQLLFPLLEIMRPWIKTPNVALFTGRYGACTSCGSENLRSNGMRTTASGTYRRITCVDCGFHNKEFRRLSTTELRP